MDSYTYSKEKNIFKFFILILIFFTFSPNTVCAQCATNADGNCNGRVDENELISSLKTLFAVTENYPDLKASGNFLELQNELVDTEDRIQAARRFYNGNVREYNNRVQMFPSSIFASVFHFREAEFFQINEFERTAPAVEI